MNCHKLHLCLSIPLSSNALLGVFFRVVGSLKSLSMFRFHLLAYRASHPQELRAPLVKNPVVGEWHKHTRMDPYKYPVIPFSSFPFYNRCVLSSANILNAPLSRAVHWQEESNYLYSQARWANFQVAGGRGAESLVRIIRNLEIVKS
jgi:hypothetical protein